MYPATQLHCFTATQLHSCTASQLNRYAASQLHSYTAPQLPSYTATRVHCYTATLHSTGTQLHCYTDSQQHCKTAIQLPSYCVQLHRTAPPLKATQLPRNTGVLLNCYNIRNPLVHSYIRPTQLPVHFSKATFDPPSPHSSWYTTTKQYSYI